MLPAEPQHNNAQNSFPYEICNLLLGKGGSGQVFLGRLPDSENYVAIKKRYAKCDTTKQQGRDHPSREDAEGESLTIPSLQGTQNALCLSLNARSGIAGGAKSNCQQEWSESNPLSQRREMDIGEESITQVVALSQQSSQPVAVVNAEQANAVPRKSPAFMDEASILETLGPHPQIVKYLGQHAASRHATFFAMELMDSDVARELAEANASISAEGTCIAVGYSVLKALVHLHDCGVAHRDVKPGNILLKKLSGSECWPSLVTQPEACNPIALPQDKQENKKPTSSGAPPCYVKAALGDFSAAHSAHNVEEVPFADARGTLHYKAPEQLLGRRSAVSSNYTAVDVWALGCTLLEMLTGEKPFPGRSELQVLMNVLDLLGSDIQSFPAVSKAPTLFRNVQVSAPFLDLLQRLLSLDAEARPTAREALQHPVFAQLRRAEMEMKKAEGVAGDSGTDACIVAIPLPLQYASYTHLPQLRFLPVCRPSPKPAVQASDEHRSAADAPAFGFVTSQTTGDRDLAALSALTHYAQREDSGALEGVPGSYVSWSALGKVNAAHENNSQADIGSLRSPDATAASLLSEGSYLHWSEVRPKARPSTLGKAQAQRPAHPAADRRDQSGSDRAVALFCANTGSTPSPSAPRNVRQLSESSHRPSTSAYRNSVARALNISDSSIKVARTERSASHVEFDLSPVAATQLFGADGDISSCLVPHPAIAAVPRPPLPVLQLKSGSTFTASNLRANSAYERTGISTANFGVNGRAVAASAGDRGGAMTDNSSTPREQTMHRTTAYAGRALCFSEETDLFARRSTGSCPSQQSCLNSLLTSPAPLSRAHEGSSPHPSPIRPVGVAARSPSGLPIAEHSGLSSDDSGVGLAWMGIAVHGGAAAGVLPDASVSVATAAAGPAQPSSEDCELVQAAQAAKVAPVLTTARTEPMLCSCGNSAPASSSLLGNSPQLRRCMPCSLTRDSATMQAAPPVITGSTPLSTNCASSQSSALGGADGGGTVRILPLPVPLSVAAGNRTPSGSRALSHSSSRKSASKSQRSTPHTQRFPHTALGLQRRSASAIVNGGTCPTAQRHCDPRDSTMLQNRDINTVLPVSEATQKTRRGEGSAVAATSALPPSESLFSASTPRTVAALRAQRHCTPSSAEPGGEASADTKYMAQQPPSSAVRHSAHSQSASRSCAESLLSTTPLAKERGSYKRAREEVAADLAQQTAE